MFTKSLVFLLALANPFLALVSPASGQTISHGEQVIPYASSLALNVSYAAAFVTLTGNVTSIIPATGSFGGQSFHLTLCQGTGGPYSIASTWSNTTGATAIATTGCTRFRLVWDDPSTTWVSTVEGTSATSITLTTTGSSGAATLSGGTLNIPNYVGSGSSGINSGASYDVPYYASGGTTISGVSGTGVPVFSTSAAPTFTAIGTSGATIPLNNSANTWGANQVIGPTNTAVSGTNYGSFTHSSCASYYSSAAQSDCWGWTITEGTGTNPTSTYTLARTTASTGGNTVTIPAGNRSISFGVVAGNPSITGSTGTIAFQSPISSTGTITSSLGTAAITSTGAGSGVTSITCQTATCTVSRGTYTVVGGSFATGVFSTLTWPTTGTAWACTVIPQGAAGSTYVVTHSVATATGMTISAAATIASATFTFDYHCEP